MFRKIILGLLLGLLPLQASAGIILPETGDQAYLDYGATFDAVVGVFGHKADGTIDWLGSGTVVSTRDVLFGAHQLGTVPNTYASFSIRTGTSLLSAEADAIFTGGGSPIIHPDYVEIGTGPDLALIKFQNDITGLTPSTLFNGAVQLGDQVHIAGFGGTGTPGSALTYDFQKRGFIDSVDRLNPFFWTDDYFGTIFDPLGSGRYSSLGTQLAFGDSGGGWYVFDEGILKLAGITSGGLIFTTYGSESFASRIDTDWIEANIDTSAAAVPEPTSFVLLSIGALGAFRRSRKKT